MLLSTHDMHEADEVCDEVAIMDKGKVVALDESHILKKKDNRGRTKNSQTKKHLYFLKNTTAP